MALNWTKTLVPQQLWSGGPWVLLVGGAQRQSWQGQRDVQGSKAQPGSEAGRATGARRPPHPAVWASPEGDGPGRPNLYYLLPAPQPGARPPGHAKYPLKGNKQRLLCTPRAGGWSQLVPAALAGVLWAVPHACA